VRRCFRGLVDSVKEFVLAVCGAGVEGRESFDLACEDERRFRAIVAKTGHDKSETCGACS
jgi:hypothetical protein